MLDVSRQYLQMLVPCLASRKQEWMHRSIPSGTPSRKLNLEADSTHFYEHVTLKRLTQNTPQKEPNELSCFRRNNRVCFESVSRPAATGKGCVTSDMWHIRSEGTRRKITGFLLFTRIYSLRLLWHAICPEPRDMSDNIYTAKHINILKRFKRPPCTSGNTN